MAGTRIWRTRQDTIAHGLGVSEATFEWKEIRLAASGREHLTWNDFLVAGRGS